MSETYAPFIQGSDHTPQPVGNGCSAVDEHAAAGSTNAAMSGDVYDKHAATNKKISDAYDPTSGTYEVGDFVIQNDKLYKCKTAISTPEAFDPAKWDETPLADVVSTISSDLSELDSNLIVRKEVSLTSATTFGAVFNVLESELKPHINNNKLVSAYLKYTSGADTATYIGSRISSGVIVYNFTANPYYGSVGYDCLSSNAFGTLFHNGSQWISNTYPSTTSSDYEKLVIYYKP